MRTLWYVSLQIPMLWVSSLLVAADALATTFDIRFCPEVDIDYDDAFSGAGDKWVNNANRPARGFRVKVFEDTSPPVIVWYDFVSESGSTVGCTPVLHLDSAKSYDVTVTSEAQIGTNEIISVDNETDGNRAITKIIDDWSPTQDEDVVGTPLPGATEPRWNHLAVASYALFRQDAGLDGETFYLDTEMCGTAPFTYYCSNENANSAEMHLGSIKRKFLVTHELGHGVATLRDAGGLGCNYDYTANEDGCHGDASTLGHGQLTKEYQSAAGCEGIADFYSALVWNDSDANDDCHYVRQYSLDWNDNGDDDTLTSEAHACIGDPFSGTPDPVDDYDWLEDLIAADDDDDDGIQCTGTLANRGTQYDWLRYFWGMATVEGVPVADLWQIWDDADPHDWALDDTGTTASSCASADFPIDRIYCAASTNLYLSEHFGQDENGLDH